MFSATDASDIGISTSILVNIPTETELKLYCYTTPTTTDVILFELIVEIFVSRNLSRIRIPAFSNRVGSFKQHGQFYVK